MKVNRLELIEKLKGMIQTVEDRAAARRAEALEKVQTDQAQYLTEHRADWEKLATTIRYRLRRDQPVTSEDIPEGIRYSRNAIAVYTPRTFRESDYVPRVDHLHRLLTVLESSPDEFVSTSALDRIGAPLRELMRP